MPVFKAREYLFYDIHRFFRAGIVAGDHHKIRIVCGNGAHDGPFQLIPVPAAAEDGDELSPGEGPQGLQHVFQGVGLMGIVDYYGVIPVGGHRLHAALHSLCRSQGVGAFVQAYSQTACRGNDTQGVMYREHAGDIQPHQGYLPSMDCGKAHAVGGEAYVLCDYIGVVSLRRVAGHRAFQPPGHKVRPLVVQVDAGGGALGKELLLCGGVFLHGPVEVQVVLTQVGEHRHVEAEPRHPLQSQGMGGDLHHHVGTARLLHGAKQFLQLIALRGGVLGVDELVAYHVAVGADKAHLCPQLILQQVL